MLHPNYTRSSRIATGSAQKKCVQKSHFLRLKKRVTLALKAVAPPPPHSMLKSCVRSRGLASPPYFPTLHGDAGGRQKSALLEAGRNTTFGALLEVLGARDISWFVATVPRKFWKMWRCRKNFRPKSCEIAQKSARPVDARHQ